MEEVQEEEVLVNFVWVQVRVELEDGFASELLLEVQVVVEVHQEKVIIQVKSLCFHFLFDLF